MSRKVEVIAAAPPAALAGRLMTPHIEWSWLAGAAAVLAVAWLALVPIAFMLWQSVLSPQTATSAARNAIQPVESRNHQQVGAR